MPPSIDGLSVGDPLDPEWREACQRACDAFAARVGGGDAVRAQAEDTMRWAVQGHTVEVIVPRLMKLNEALLRLGVAALVTAVSQVNDPNCIDAPIDHAELLEMLRGSLEEPEDPDRTVSGFDF